MSDLKDIWTREELSQELERYNQLRDSNLENKLLKQKAEIVKDIQDAIRKIPKTDTTPVVTRMDKCFDDIEGNCKDIKKEVDQMQIKQTIMNEQLNPIKKIVWSVLVTMITAIVGAIIGLVLYK